MEKIISHLEEKIKELDHSAKENVKSKKLQEHNMKGTPGHHNNTKPSK